MLDSYPEIRNFAGKQVDMASRQDPLRKQYETEPQAAWVVDSARTLANDISPSYPLVGAVKFCDHSPVSMPTGVHTKVGGNSDYPTPGDILCGAIAACLDSIIRIIANRLSVNLTRLEVEVLGGLDVRGTLLVDNNVPVGFQRFDITVDMHTDDDQKAKLLDTILAAAENSCVVLQTLRDDLDVVIKRR